MSGRCPAVARGGSAVDDLQADHARVDQNFAGMRKINSNTRAVDRLHLAVAPIGPIGMADALAGLERGSEALGELRVVWIHHV